MDSLPLKISFFAYFPQIEQFALPQVTYETAVLFCIKEGSLRYKIGVGSWHIASSGAIVLCPADTLFYRQTLSPCSLVVVKATGGVAFSASDAPVYPPEASRVQSDLEQLTKNGFAFTDSPSAEICHYAADLWYTACAAFPPKKAPLQEVYDYITSHCCEDISIQALAAAHGYTPPRLIALFNKHYGAPPKNIISKHRIQKAQSLLLQTNLSVGEISLECGYEDTLYFSRIFSKYCGCSPSQFRKQESI